MLSARRLAVLAGCLLLLTIVHAAPVRAADRWTDITDAQWVTDYQVTADQAAGVADGYADGTFRPKQTVNRGQFAKMSVSGLSLDQDDPAQPTFSDVSSSHLFYAYIEGAAAAKVINGYPDGSFRPGELISRQQANSMMGRYLSDEELRERGTIKGEMGNYPSLAAWYAYEGLFNLGLFADEGTLAAVHRPATAYLVAHGILKGSGQGADRRLTPNASLSRAQAATMIIRTMAEWPKVTNQIPPVPPAALSMHPGGPSAEPRPILVGKTIAFGEVTVYDSFEGTRTVGMQTADREGSFYVELPQEGALGEGLHIFRAKVTDENGLESDFSEAVEYLYDATAPQGEMIQPIASAALRQRQPSFVVTALDDVSGVSTATFQYRAAGASDWITISIGIDAPYRASWNDISLSDGQYEFRSVVRDRAGNEATVGPVSVTVDLGSPTVELTQPLSGGVFYTESRAPMFTADAVDPPAREGIPAAGIESVEFLYALKSSLPSEPSSWQASDFSLVSAAFAAPFAAQWGGLTLPDGDYVFAVQAQDRAGNRSPLRTQEVVVDASPPMLALVAPGARAVVSAQSGYDVKWTLEDVSGVATVKIEYSLGEGAPWVTIADAAPNTGVFSWPVPVAPPEGAPCRLRLTAVDRAGAVLGSGADHTTTITSEAFTVAQALEPPQAVSAADNDTDPGVDGRDVSVAWTPSSSPGVGNQRVYLLRSGTPLVLVGPGAAAPMAVLIGNTATTWTGTEDLVVDSAGLPLGAGSYSAYVAAVGEDLRLASSTAAPAVLVDP